MFCFLPVLAVSQHDYSFLPRLFPGLQLRRGLDKADVYSLAFSPSDQHLAATSDRGTVHVFALHQAEGEEGTGQQPTHPPRSVSAAAAAAASSVAHGQLAAGASFLQSSSLSFVQGM